MKKVIALIGLLIIVLFNHSCRKENPSNIDWQGIQKCNDALHLDSAGIANRLIGKWILKSWRCGECINPGTHTPDKTVIATFTSARQFTVTENSTIIAQGNWNLGIVDLNNWGLQSASSLSYLNGYILFCDNQVLFSYSYIDGPDNLFVKVN